MARVLKLGLRNFKSIGQQMQTVDLAPITLLFGPNSAGKSTLLQSLVYLREIIVNRNLDPDQTELGGSWLDLGGFRNLVHGRDLDEPIEISIDLSVSSEELPQYINEYEADLLAELDIPAVQDFLTDLEQVGIDIRLRWSNSLGRVVVENYKVRLNNKEVASISASLDGRQVQIDKLPLDFPGFQEEIEIVSGGPNFAQLLEDLFKASVFSRGDSVSFPERELIQRSIDELETMVRSVSVPSKKLLQQIKAELDNRSTRRAHALAVEVEELLEEFAESPIAEYIGLFGQRDALPHGFLELDGEIWETPDEEVQFNDALKRLALALINTAICGPLHLLTEWLDNLNYIGPLRDLPPRAIQSHNTPDKSRWAKGLAAWELLPGAKASLIDELNFWLGENCLDSGYQILVKRYRELESDHPIHTMLEGDLELDDLLIAKQLIDELPEKVRVCLLEESSNLEVMPQDIGVGISQLFPVIALAVTQNEGLAAIEQPELHIHPRLQVELADIFVRYSQKREAMFLLETHSEHLLLRLLRRVREENEETLSGAVTLKAGDVAVHYVEPSDKGTIFKRLRVNDEGDFIDEWPQGFFDERDEELFF